MISPSQVKKLLDRHGFQLKRSLGQNFLIDANILNRIVEGAEIKEDDNVLEVGPGIGSLTRALARVCAKVVAVEIDRALFPILDETLKDYDNAYIIHGDILKIDLGKIMTEYFEGEPFKVVANLPYYITSPILMTFLESDLPYEDITVMVQSEVADRIMATPGTKDYGLLTVAINYYAEVFFIAKVPPSVFMPRPKVSSQVIKLVRKADHMLDKSAEELFFQVIKAAFSKRRKTLLNALSSYPSIKKIGDKVYIREILGKANIDPARRGETLDYEEFACIAQILRQHLSPYDI
ncbi:MAG: 16S rRNA (adenine(1518)-N(6)/adenine(1519)-N(6))-dimethyltransferase RsmA [Clostridiales bacterium]|nr:16S rRNA (adenine(1518)-N(6)/adenine(1519)-N(6))-dimethyltransferase RsmA [Clostridiales bacterium]